MTDVNFYTMIHVNTGPVIKYRKGVLQNGRGGWGEVKFYPLQKGAKNVLAMLKGGGGKTILNTRTWSLGQSEGVGV